jgi:hypothetical protein
MSPPVAVRFCAPGFERSQSGTKFPLLSVQVRVALKTALVTGLLARAIV